MVQRKRKPQRGDRELSKLFSNKLDILSPPRGFCYCRNLTGGFTPVCSLSHLRCFNPNSSQQETPFKRGCLTLHGESAYTPRRIGLHSTENRLTLHGASAFAPRSIGLRSTERKTPPLRGTVSAPEIIDARGTFLPLPFRPLHICVSDEKQLIGAYQKSRRDERSQTGAQAPGNDATRKEAPKGRQSS